MRGIALLVNRYLRAAGITDRSGPHLLRHTFATHALRARPNAMTSDQFIAWLEGKLDEHDVQKVIPEDEMLGAAYRRAVFLQQLDAAQSEVAERVKADSIALPTALPKKVERLLRETPELSWDQAIWKLAAPDGDRDAGLRNSLGRKSLRNPDKGGARG